MWTFAVIISVLVAAAAADTSDLRVGNCPLNATSIDDCDFVQYGINASSFFVPPLLISILLLLTCPLYCSFKYCCNCCGGRNQNPNCCCGCTDKKVVYSRINLYRAKLYPIIILGIGIVMFIIGYTGGAKALSNADSFLGEITNVPNILDSRLDSINDSLTVEFYDDKTDTSEYKSILDQSSTGKDLRAAADSIKKQINDQLVVYVDKIRPYLTGYPWVPYIIFGIPVVFFIIGCVAALFNLRVCLPISMAWFMFFFGFIMWIMHGTCSFGAFTLSGMCAEVHSLTEGRQNVIASVAQCKDSWFTDFTTTFADLEKQQSTEACKKFLETSYVESKTVEENIKAKTVYKVPSDVDCSNVVFADIYTLTDDIYTHPKLKEEYDTKKADLATLKALPEYPGKDKNVEDAEAVLASFDGVFCSNPVGNCTIKRCADECTENGVRSTIGKLSRSVVVLFHSAVVTASTMDTLGAEYSDCDTVMAIIIAPLDPSCGKLTDGLVLLRIASGSMACLCMLFIFAMMFGSKRFAEYISIGEYCADEKSPFPEK